MRALIDGDIICYRFAFLNEYDVDFATELDADTSEVVTIMRIEDAKKNVDDFIRHIVKEVKADDYMVMLSGDDNFRYGVYPDYKANRNQSTVPTLKDIIKRYILENHPSMLEPTLEADDLLGLLQVPMETVICTIDKDLDQIEGDHYNWNKDEHYFVTKEDGDMFFYKQILTGDPTDGYSGCPQIGPKKADKFFLETSWATEEELFEKMVDLYHSQMVRYKDPNTTREQAHEFALSNAGVARMLRGDEFNFETKEIKIYGRGAQT